MRRSKLEMHIDILKVLAQRGPLKLTHVMHKANLSCSMLKGCLEFLIKQGVVEEVTLKKVYREKDRIRLQPANSRMKPIYTEPDNVEIQGKVIAVIRQLD